MAIEIELRGRFDQAHHAKLLTYLSEHGEDLGANNKEIYFYVLPDKLLKVVNNTSTGTAKISLKGSRIGHGEAFSETEMTIPQTEVPTAVKIFNDLGFADTMHQAVNERHDFLFQDVEIALKYSQAWGFHAEFEILLPDTASQDSQDDAIASIRRVAAELDVHLMTEDELLDFTAAFEKSAAH